MAENSGRKLIVEVCSAKNLMPKDGQGTASAYAVVDFDGQRRRTTTKSRDLNPQWDEKLEFIVHDKDSMASETLEVNLYNDKKLGKRSTFLGKVKISGSSFVKSGTEEIVYYPLEKRSVFSQIKGELGLKVSYVDDDPPPPPSADADGELKAETAPPPAAESTKEEEKKEEKSEENKQDEEKKEEEQSKPPEEEQEKAKAPPDNPKPKEEAPAEAAPPQPEAEVQNLAKPQKEKHIEIIKRAENNHLSVNDHELRSLSSDRSRSTYDLVDRIPFLYVRMVKAKRANSSESGSKVYAKLVIGTHSVKTKSESEDKDWDQVFAFDKEGLNSTSLEVSVWCEEKKEGEEITENSLGTVSFDLQEVPKRVPPDSPLAPQWYTLESDTSPGNDVMLAVWIGTQADEAFQEAWQSDSGGLIPETRAKVYLSPKLWYLRVTVIQTQDLQLGSGSEPKLRSPELYVVKGQLGAQVFKTGRTSAGGSAASSSANPTWNEDLVFVHVIDEATHVTSDARASAKQLCKAPIGLLEVGIRGATNLLPVKTKDGTRGTTDAFAVAKYGPKWIRTRTIIDRFNPRWNEQYTWDVYDPCTVLTIGVFDNGRYKRSEEGKLNKDVRLGKIRVRLSTLDTNRVYVHSYSLTVLLPSGAKKMGEIEIAVRFSCSSWLSLMQAYTSPILPRMHYVKPFGPAQQDILRHMAMRIVTARLARSEPPLGHEVVQFMLDSDTHVWSMRRSKANWFRVISCISRAASLARWFDGIRRWVHPPTTILMHVLLLAIVFCPSLVLPTAFMYCFLILLLRFRYRQRVPQSMDPRVSCVDMVSLDELDEEFDGFPTTRSPEVVRIRYDRVRALAGRAQTLLGDVAAQGERLEALFSWRDPRATAMFAVLCFVLSLVFYVVPFKGFVLGAGFYYFRHPRFRDDMPSVSANFYRRLPSLSDQII
ncbi:protein QUIRKY [Arachis duranensis]|uniref:Protein QUIRKY n=1 Tax=Arachis duranensis TaxID=130453 RepID=A0A6P4BZD5_ARADU|nr:protein QUIRKY [Arachis duranensis]